MVERLRFEYVFLEQYKLSNINFTLFESEILCLVAQNHNCRRGLMELMSGGCRPDSGSLFIAGEKTALSSRLDAKKKRIGSIFTQSQLVPNMSIYENIFIIREGSYFSKLHSSRFYYVEAQKLLEEFDLTGISPSDRAWSLTQPEQHLIEIIKAVSLQANVIVIDNITDKYTDRELEELAGVLCCLREKGISVIFLANKYSSLFSAADRVVIVREGTTASVIDHSFSDRQELRQHISAVPDIGVTEARPGDVVLRAQELRTGESGKTMSFSVRKGESLGIIETVWERGRALCGAITGREPYQGRLLLADKEVKLKSPGQAIREGIGYVAENETGGSIIGTMNLTDNIALMLDRRYNNALGLLNMQIRRFKAIEALKELGCCDLWEEYGMLKQLPLLSKAEQMKVVLAKWICVKPRLLVLFNPHLGFGEKSMGLLADMLGRVTESGTAALIVSTSISSLEILCDRITAFE